MATKNFRSTVLDPTSEFARGDKLRFTALSTVGEVLKGSFSEETIVEDGVYSVDLQYGKHRIDYKPYEGIWQKFADVEVSADTLATTLQDLALASVPVTDETVLVLQGILADAEAAKTESAAIRDEAAASAAAAAADAEKLADIKPNDIGAVDNTGDVAFAVTESVHFVSSEKKYIIVEMPANENVVIGIRARIISRIPQFNNEIFVSFYNYPYNNAVLGLTCHQASTFQFNYDVRWSDDKSKAFVVIDTVASFFDAKFAIIDALTSFSAASVDNFRDGWIVTSSNDLPVNTASRAYQSVDNLGIVGSSKAVAIEHEGRVYYHSNRDDALKIDGIPYDVFDSALAEQQNSELFESEKSIALQIFADFNLGTGDREITGSDIADVRAYIQSIDPAKGLKAGHLQRAKIPRPSIFDRYKKNPYEL